MFKKFNLDRTIIEWQLAEGIEGAFTRDTDTMVLEGDVTIAGLMGKFSYAVKVNSVDLSMEFKVFTEDQISDKTQFQILKQLNEINQNLKHGNIAVEELGLVVYRSTMKLATSFFTVEFLKEIMSEARESLKILFSQNSVKEEFSAVLEYPLIQDPLEWADIEGGDNIRQWAQSLKEGVKFSIGNHWELIGKGVVLISQNVDYVQNVLDLVAREAGYDLLVTNKSFNADLSSFGDSLDGLKKGQPLLVYLKPGEWFGRDSSFELDAKPAVKDFKETIKKIFADFSVKQPVVFVTSTRDLDHLAPELKKKGLFDVFMSLPAPSYELIGKRFINFLDKQICAESLQSNFGKVGHLVGSFSDDKFELIALNLKRLSKFQNRKIEYIDLVDLQLHNLVEEGILQEKDEAVKRQTAYHEAGHALISIIEYAGKNIPDYISILPGASGFAGITMQSSGFWAQKSSSQNTFLDLQKGIRLFLGGRAGEEILVGSSEVSDGAYGDLQSATQWVQEAFAYYGFHPQMDKDENSGSNLAIITGEVTHSQAAHVELLSRQFLSQEYQVTLNILKQNRSLLDDISERLMIDPIVDQNELVELCKKHQINVDPI